MRRSRLASAILLTAATLLTTSVGAQAPPVIEAPLYQAPFVAPRDPGLLRRVALESTAPAAVLPAATEEIVEPIRIANRDPMSLMNGVTRLLPEEHSISLGSDDLQSVVWGSAVNKPDGSLHWGYRIRVENSYRLRLRLADLDLPKDARLWVHSGNEVVGPFGRELAGPNGVLWTPSVAGPEISLELELPTTQFDSSDDAALRVEGIMQIFELDQAYQPILSADERGSIDTSCLLDAKCFTEGNLGPVHNVKRATAHLQFVKDGSGSLCTGHLVNDTVSGSFIPYLLTANHCFDSQASASSLEAFFDFEATFCGGPPPSLGSLPRTSGAQLLRTNASNDMTFVRLNQNPAGNRVLLGWTTAVPSNGSTVHRISHPGGLQMAYTRTRIQNNPSTSCQGAPTSRYFYTATDLGGTAGGSSGGALVNNSGQIIGQLLGSCGSNANCDPSNETLDGKFSVTYPLVQQWIDPDTGGGDTCTPNLTNGVACLRNGRFRVTAEWTDFSNPPVTQPLILTPVEDINATGGFQNNPTGIQIVVRIADACSLTGTYWPWVGGFTGAGWNITFEDLATGKSRTFVRTRNGTDFPTTERDITTFNCN